MNNLYKHVMICIALGIVSFSANAADEGGKEESYNFSNKRLYVKAEAGIAVPKTIKYDSWRFVAKAPSASGIYGLEFGYRLSGKKQKQDNKLGFRPAINIGYMSRLKAKDYSTDVFDRTSVNGVNYQFTGAKIESAIAEINGYFDVLMYQDVVPYFTAGVGYASNRLSNLKLIMSETASTGNTGIFNINPATLFAKIKFDSNRKGNFAWNAGFGMYCELSESFSIDLTYRYRDLGRIEFPISDDGADVQTSVAQASTKGLSVEDVMYPITGGEDSIGRVRTNNVMLGIIWRF